MALPRRCSLRLVLLLVTACWIEIGTPAAQEQGTLTPKQTIGRKEVRHDRALALSYLKEGKVVQAISLLEKIQAINGNDLENGHDLVLAYAQTGQIEKARALANHLLAIQNSAGMHSMLGDVETAARNFKASAAEYQIAAQMDPSESRVFDFANSLMHFSSDAAVKLFTYGVDKYPSSARLRAGLGVAFFLYGDHNQAAKSLCQAVDMNPSDSRPIDFLGKLEEDPNDLSPETYRQVVQHLYRLQEAQPKSARVKYYLAQNLLTPSDGIPSQKDLAQGEQLLREAIRLDPRMADAYFQLGLVLEKKKQYKQAIIAYQHAANLNPKEAKYHLRLPFIYRRVGEEQKAIEELRIYERLKADEEEPSSHSAEPRPPTSAK